VRSVIDAVARPGPSTACPRPLSRGAIILVRRNRHPTCTGAGRQSP